MRSLPHEIALPDSIHHKPFRGPEQVRVYLVFDVVELDMPGSVLVVRNLIVR